MRVDDCEVLQAAVDAACVEFVKHFPEPLDGSFGAGVEAVVVAALAALPDKPAADLAACRMERDHWLAKYTREKDALERLQADVQALADFGRSQALAAGRP